MWISSKGLTQLQNKIKDLDHLLDNRRVYFLLEENIPEGETGRKKYVGDVAYFYSTIFKDKLAHLIGLQMEELSQVGRDVGWYSMIRSNINALRLIDEWSDKMTKEHFGNLEQMRESFDSDKDFISNLKDKYEN